MKTINNLVDNFNSFRDTNDKIKNSAILLKICDVLLNDFSDQLRSEPFYSFSLDIIDELIDLRININPIVISENTDLYIDVVVKEMNLLKKVAPPDEKMQKIINRLFRG